jgi:nickel-dependent lactate racemase
MRIQLCYGPGQLDIELPEQALANGARVDVLEKQPIAPIADPDAALRAELAAPRGTLPLDELARGRRDAVIVVSDITRPVPNALLLPPLLDALRRAGLPREAIALQVATGLHRPNTQGELDQMLGTELARSLRIVQHDARDAAAHADLGTTSSGIPIRLDRFYLERDFRILTGMIEPHLMAGFSGGRKALCPGLAATETMRAAHSPAMIEDRIGPGILEGNPLHDALLEVMRRAGADFLANVALDRERRVIGVFCGDPEEAHADGMAFVDRESHAALDEPADLVIVSAGGAPLDATFYQAIKGIATASCIVRPGGAILLCAALSEGVGSASFEKLLRETRSPEEFELRLADDAFFAIDQWMLQHLCQAQRRARVLLYTDGLPLEAAGELLVEAVPTPEVGVERALSRLGPRPRIAVVPQGPYILATVRGEKRPLGRAGDAHPPT